MDTEVFDAIIVGAGQAGPAIAARCSLEGLKTAVIERHHRNLPPRGRHPSRAEVCASLSATAHRGIPLSVAILGARMPGLTRIMVRTS
jgi:2-polyprenyl-6-methoxyphenol hydroxylase-like FAD-dependent oxidoreductase